MVEENSPRIPLWVADFKFSMQSAERRRGTGVVGARARARENVGSYIFQDL